MYFFAYIRSFHSHAEPCREGSSCQGTSKQHTLCRKVMPGERMVWFPPERLCTGTKRKEEELRHSRDQGEGCEFLTWVRWSLKGCIYNVTTMEFIKMSTKSFSSKSNAKDQQQ